MSRIGFITIQKANNGSVLQTFATSYILRKLGHQPVLIDYQYPTEYHKKNAMGREAKIHQAPFYVKALKNIIRIIYRLFHNLPLRPKQYRNWCCELTQNKYWDFLCQIEKTSISYDKDRIVSDPPQFDIYLTGSDQTWNPRYYANDFSFLLNFAPDDKPKIAYAASYGTSKFYPQFAKDYGMYLKRYDAISTRESTGVKITRELAGKESFHCCDPTMLLTKEDWMQFASSSRINCEKYILVYLMTYALNPFPFVYKLISRVQKKLGIKNVVFIGNDVANAIKGYKMSICTGPSEFIRLFADASFIITSSFHGTAFSVNFRKPFLSIIGSEKSSDNRQSDLLEHLGMESRMVRVNGRMPESITELELDYGDYDKKILDFRSTSMDYLKRVLK